MFVLEPISDFQTRFYIGVDFPLFRINRLANDRFSINCTVKGYFPYHVVNTHQHAVNSCIVLSNKLLGTYNINVFNLIIKHIEGKYIFNTFDNIPIGYVVHKTWNCGLPNLNMPENNGHIETKELIQLLYNAIGDWFRRINENGRRLTVGTKGNFKYKTKYYINKILVGHTKDLRYNDMHEVFINLPGFDHENDPIHVCGAIQANEVLNSKLNEWFNTVRIDQSLCTRLLSI